jgi:hypothetical protein
MRRIIVEPPDPRVAVSSFVTKNERQGKSRGPVNDLTATRLNPIELPRGSDIYQAKDFVLVTKVSH